MGTRRNLSRIRDGLFPPVPIFFVEKKPLISGTNTFSSSVVEHSSLHAKVEGSIPVENDDRDRKHSQPVYHAFVNIAYPWTCIIKRFTVVNASMP
jgi:hypothetical protein